MISKTRIAERLTAAVVVATGIAVAWAIAITWFGLIASSLVSSGDSVYDTLRVRIDGTPIIYTTRTAENVSLSENIRTLDGKTVTDDGRGAIDSAYFPVPYKPSGIIDIPVAWNTGLGRIAGAADGKPLPAGWWFVRDDEHTGGVYVAGYDAISKLPIGFIGRHGFSASKPPTEEQFIVPYSTSDEGFRYLIDIDQNLAYRRMLYQYQVYNNRDWTAFLLGTDTLWEVDLRERTARSWGHFNNALALGRVQVANSTFNRLPVRMTPTRQQLFELKEKEKNKGEDKSKDKSQDKDTVAKEKAVDAQKEKEDEDAGNNQVLNAIRQSDRIVFFDLWTGKMQSFILPEELRTRRLSVFLTGADEMLVDAHEQGEEFWSGGPIVRLFWINSQGQIRRQEEVRLAGPVPASQRKVVRWLGVLAPVSIAWIVGLLVVAPFVLLQMNMAPNYMHALAHSADISWPPLIGVLLLAVVLAWLTLRMQRKYRRSATRVWTTFVFLFGVPGLLAYLVENRRPKLESCRQCGEIVPRDREACAVCNSEFAPPPRVGTEIFA